MKDFIPLILGIEVERNDKKDKDKEINESLRVWRDRGERRYDRTLHEVSVEDAVSKNRLIVIKGDPGSGKSTLLKHIAWKKAEDINEENYRNSLLPLYLSLKSWSEHHSEYSFIESLKDSFKNSGLQDLFFEYMKNSIEKGNAIILLDGLDEITDRGNFIENSLKKFIYGIGKKCKIIITTRFSGYNNELTSWKHYEIMEFTGKQKKQFTDVYFKDKPEKAELFIKVINEPKSQMRVLSSNPLLLNLMCIVYENDNLELPTHRVDLYDSITEIILRHYFINRGREETELDELVCESMEILKRLAFEGFICGKEVFSYKDDIYNLFRKDQREFISTMPYESGLLQKLSSGVYTFIHLTFQEYFTACALAKMNNYLDIVRENLWDWERWEEVILLLSATIESPDELINLLLDYDDNRTIEEAMKNPAKDKEPFRNMLFLAARCCGESNVTEKTAETVIKLLKDILTGDTNSHIFRGAAEIFRKISTEEAIKVFIELLEDDDYAVRRFSLEALGKIDSAKAMEILIKSLKDENNSVRCFAISALEKISSEKFIEPLIGSLKDEDSFVRYYTIKALEKIGSEKAIKAFIESLKDKDYDGRYHVAEALGNIGSKETVKPLVELLKHQDSSVRKYAVETLGKIGSEESVKPIIESLKDKDINVRTSAVEALGKIGSEESIKVLRELLKDEDIFMRCSAAKALGKIGADEAIKFLIELLNHVYGFVRWSAAEALGDIGSKDAIKALKESLKDEDSIVRQSVSKALIKIGSEEVIKPLIELLNDQDSSVRWSAAEFLGKIGSEEAVEPLIESLKDENSLVQQYTAEALGNIGSEKAVEPLIELLNDKDNSGHYYIIEALGKIGAEKAIEPIVTFLRGHDFSVHWPAVEALGKIGSSTSLEPLIESLEHVDSSVRRAAAEALEKIIRVLRIEEKILNPLHELSY